VSRRYLKALKETLGFHWFSQLACTLALVTHVPG
jgi:hypothetical protein